MKNKIEKETEEIEYMISFFCRKKHHTKKPCNDCEALIKYSKERLKNCYFGEQKTSCSRCKIHCYGPEEREKIREVMKYVGPRMIYLMPFRYIAHWLNR